MNTMEKKYELAGFGRDIFCALRELNVGIPGETTQGSTTTILLDELCYAMEQAMNETPKDALPIQFKFLKETRVQRIELSIRLEHILTGAVRAGIITQNPFDERISHRFCISQDVATRILDTDCNYAQQVRAYAKKVQHYMEQPIIAA